MPPPSHALLQNDMIDRDVDLAIHICVHMYRERYLDAFLEKVLPRRRATVVLFWVYSAFQPQPSNHDDMPRNELHESIWLCPCTIQFRVEPFQTAYTSPCTSTWALRPPFDGIRSILQASWGVPVEPIFSGACSGSRANGRRSPSSSSHAGWVSWILDEDFNIVHIIV